MNFILSKCTNQSRKFIKFLRLADLLGLVAMLCAIVTCTCNVRAESTTYSITIENSTEGHTYEAYQIFTGNLATDASNNKILSNLEWGDSVASTGSWNSASAAAASIAVNSNMTESSEAASPAIKTFLSSIELKSSSYKSTSTLSNGKYVIDGLVPGYYLIKDKNDSLSGKNDSYTSYILKIVRNVSSVAKSAIPTSYKKVKDINDTNDSSTGDWEDSADYDIGDAVPFQINGVVASNYANYKVYKFIFHDTLSSGLSLDADSVKVYLTNNGVKKALTTGFTVNPSGTSESLNVTFDDLKTISDVGAGSIITVEYNATLTSGCTIGSAGNANTMYLEYSNNPNDADGKTTGYTPVDTVRVFTYQLTVNKINQSNKPLTGAAFTLEKKLKDGTKKNYTASVSSNGATFTFKGLDDGEYVLTETQTPSGYNSIDAITFTVSASHDEDSTDPALKSLTANVSSADLPTGKLQISDSGNSGILTANVINVKGNLLPETGGMGTQLFYIIGGLLLMLAFAGLYARNHMTKR